MSKSAKALMFAAGLALTMGPIVGGFFALLAFHLGPLAPLVTLFSVGALLLVAVALAEIFGRSTRERPQRPTEMQRFLAALSEGFDQSKNVEPVERVARAIFDHAASKPAGQPAWDVASEDVREWVRDHARDAIRAMREPTDAMVAAGIDDIMAMVGSEHHQVTCIYRAMIDEALK